MKESLLLPLGVRAFFFEIKFRPSISWRVAIKKGAPQTPGKSKIRRLKKVFGEASYTDKSITEELAVVVCPEGTKLDIIVLWAISVGWEKASAKELLALGKTHPFLHQSMHFDSVVVSATEDCVVEDVRMVCSIMWSKFGREAELSWIENLTYERKTCFLFRKKGEIVPTR